MPKLWEFSKPSKANGDASQRAVDDSAEDTRTLVDALVDNAEQRIARWKPKRRRRRSRRARNASITPGGNPLDRLSKAHEAAFDSGSCASESDYGRDGIALR